MEDVSKAISEIRNYIEEQIKTWETVLLSIDTLSTHDNLMKEYTALNNDYHSNETIRARLDRREEENKKRAARAKALEAQHKRFAEMGLYYNPNTGRYEEVSRRSNEI